jgi:hypothetical protein
MTCTHVVLAVSLQMTFMYEDSGEWEVTGFSAGTWIPAAGGDAVCSVCSLFLKAIPIIGQMWGEGTQIQSYQGLRSAGWGLQRGECTIKIYNHVHNVCVCVGNMNTDTNVLYIHVDNKLRLPFPSMGRKAVSSSLLYSPGTMGEDTQHGACTHAEHRVAPQYLCWPISFIYFLSFVHKQEPQKQIRRRGGYCKIWCSLLNISSVLSSREQVVFAVSDY